MDNLPTTASNQAQSPVKTDEDLPTMTVNANGFSPESITIASKMKFKLQSGLTGSYRCTINPKGVSIPIEEFTLSPANPSYKWTAPSAGTFKSHVKTTSTEQKITPTLEAQPGTIHVGSVLK